MWKQTTAFTNLTHAWGEDKKHHRIQQVQFYLHRHLYTPKTIIFLAKYFSTEKSGDTSLELVYTPKEIIRSRLMTILLPQTYSLVASA